MSTTAQPSASSSGSKHRTKTSKEQFLELLEQEHDKTQRVLRAYPREKSELRPHAKSKTARELAWMFVTEQGGMEKALTTGFDWSKPPAFPPVPDSFDAVLAAFEQGHGKVARLVRDMSDEELSRTVKFFTAPKVIGDLPRLDVLWMMLRDQIHHRGQLTVYLRMAEGKVPSIYGPSADEPWR